MPVLAKEKIWTMLSLPGTLFSYNVTL